MDNGSVYTKNLLDFLNQKNILYEIQTPQNIELDKIEKYDSIILSGRRKNEKKINEVNSKIIRHSIKNDKKLLGICYGAEMLALALGGTIRKTKSLQKGDETINIFKENPISKGSMTVFESHGFEISKLPKTLVSLAESGNCKCEIVMYEGKPIFGTQFHPEMSQDGHGLIEKFCSL